MSRRDGAIAAARTSSDEPFISNMFVSLDKLFLSWSHDLMNLSKRLGHPIAITVAIAIAGAAHMASAETPKLPPGANTTNPNEPFYIDLSGLDFNTTPPTRNPANPKYPPATELHDGTLPPEGAQGNYIIGPTHNPAPEAVAQNVPKGGVFTFTMTSEQSRIYNPGFIRDETRPMPR
jgi:hypothetical protein